MDDWFYLAVWAAFCGWDVVFYAAANSEKRRKWYYKFIPGGGLAALLIEGSQ